MNHDESHRLGQGLDFIRAGSYNLLTEYISVEEVHIRIPNCDVVCAQLFTRLDNNVNSNWAIAVHGWLDNSASFMPLFTELFPLLSKSVFKYVLAVDMPGCGRSAHKTTVSYPVIESVYDIIQIVQRTQTALHLEEEKVTYIGHSLGGGHGFLLAAMFPDKIQRLIIMEHIGYNTEVEDEKLVSKLRLGMLKRMQFDSKLPGKRNLFNSFDDLVEKLHKRYKHGLKRESARYLAERSSKFVEVDGQKGWQLTYDHKHLALGLFRFTEKQLLSVMRHISVPVLLLLPEKGGWPFGPVPIIERRKKVLQASSKNYVEIRVPKTEGHHFHLDYPLETAHVLANYFIKEGEKVYSRL
jgi:pimeloyl-ACP methyl ester carboxylesterase